MNFSQHCTSPDSSDSSSFHSRELAHQPPPQKASKDINFHAVPGSPTAMGLSHGSRTAFWLVYGFIGKDQTQRQDRSKE